MQRLITAQPVQPHSMEDFLKMAKEAVGGQDYVEARILYTRALDVDAQKVWHGFCMEFGAFVGAETWHQFRSLADIRLSIAAHVQTRPVLTFGICVPSGHTACPVLGSGTCVPGTTIPSLRTFGGPPASHLPNPGRVEICSKGGEGSYEPPFQDGAGLFCQDIAMGPTWGPKTQKQKWYFWNTCVEMGLKSGHLPPLFDGKKNGQNQGT